MHHKFAEATNNESLSPEDKDKFVGFVFTSENMAIDAVRILKRDFPDAPYEALIKEAEALDNIK